MEKVYRLNDKHEVVEEPDFAAWAEWMFSNDGRRVGYDATKHAIVSTVFLGIKHVGGFFETMVFYDNGEQRTYRYQTYEKALAGHLSRVKALNAVYPPPPDAP